MNINNNTNIENLKKEIIRQKWEKTDRNGRKYLILKLDSEKTVFVFSSKIKEERWEWLEEDKEYNLTVEAGNNDSILLIDFEIEVNA